MNNTVRVRFAPSPTGPLHIGGIRTALYNYLFAKKNNGVFILRIEDTDQIRYVEGAEEYILDALNWLGLNPDESVRQRGDYGPYRQSERRAIYRDYVDQLIQSGHAYYAFDSQEELEEMRKSENAKGIHSPKYDQKVRMIMKNSLTLLESTVKDYLEKGENITVRMKVPANKVVSFSDRIRGDVHFKSEELDDKVILKADGLPTYHLANVVDDHLMKISHVIRGEEWLSSTAHHVLLYEAFGWKNEMPEFAHLPLILKPAGKGKLSKRDGVKFGFPVFPLEWYDKKENATFAGFRETGFLPQALINFLSLLGWNPGTDEEIFSLEELGELFSFEDINKSGAQFNYIKAKWFNHQYIIASKSTDLFEQVKPAFDQTYGPIYCEEDLMAIVELLKPRVEFIPEFVSKSSFFFHPPDKYDEKSFRKRFKPENGPHFQQLIHMISKLENWKEDSISKLIKGYIEKNGLKFGEIFSVLRILLTGDSSGPDLFVIIKILGRDEVGRRLQQGMHFLKDKIETDA